MFKTIHAFYFISIFVANGTLVCSFDQFQKHMALAGLNHEKMVLHKNNMLFSKCSTYSAFTSYRNTTLSNAALPLSTPYWGCLIKLDQSQIITRKSWSAYDQDFLIKNSLLKKEHVMPLREKSTIQVIQKIFKADPSQALEGLQPIFKEQIIKDLPNVNNYSIVGHGFRAGTKSYYIVRNDILDPTLKCYSYQEKPTKSSLKELLQLLLDSKKMQ